MFDYIQLIANSCFYFIGLFCTMSSCRGYGPSRLCFSFHNILQLELESCFSYRGVCGIATSCISQFVQSGVDKKLVLAG